jgi:hypothetical protein
VIRKAVYVVLKRDGWLIPFITLLVGISEYWREGHITPVGLFGSALMTAVFLMTRVPSEIRNLEAKREPL